MVLKLHGSTSSTCSRRVLVVAAECGVEVEVVPCDWAAKEHKSPAWLENQPFGQIPYLKDESDGFIVFESRAIAKYIAAKYGKEARLVPDPSDLKEVAMFDQAWCVEMADFDPYASGITKEKIFVPMFGGKTDEVALKKHTDTLKEKLDGYERILSKQKYMAGDRLTIVDLFHLPYGSMAESQVPGLFDAHPNVSRWWKELSGKPCWAKVNPPR